jgi:lipoprotein-releasing system ATP-binding protein
MSKANIFTIRNLCCSYDGKRDVVRIDKLDIPRGQFVGLLSVSGGGKSTILETIGLMNKAFRPGSEIRFYPEEEGDGYDYETLWADATEKLAAGIRRSHFSFVFQQTNLMPNFSAFENIAISQMLQGKSEAESIAHLKTIMATIGLEEITEGQNPWELSGGQQQRVAFARAIAAEFSVIFGDEPTGNLDPENARSLMQKLQEVVKEKKRTAIIVSHDLELIKDYADMLLVLTKEEKIGQIRPENIFRCQTIASDSGQSQRQWHRHNGTVVPDISQALRSTMRPQNFSADV